MGESGGSGAAVPCAAAATRESRSAASTLAATSRHNIQPTQTHQPASHQQPAPSSHMHQSHHHQHPPPPHHHERQPHHTHYAIHQPKENPKRLAIMQRIAPYMFHNHRLTLEGMYAFIEQFEQSHSPHAFFHDGQQSSKMQEEMQRRVRLLYDQKRTSQILTHRERASPPGSDPNTLGMLPMSRESVTLVLELPRSLHPDMLLDVRDGESVAVMAQETGTLIQFPDRAQHTHEQLHTHNQITITGSLCAVERVRQRIRLFTPVAILFPVVDTKPDLPLSKLSAFIKTSIEDKTLDFPRLDIEVLPPSYSMIIKAPVIRVTGREYDEEAMIACCEQLKELLFDSDVRESVQFSSHLEIPLSQRQFVVGQPEGALMVLISSFSNATLHFPRHDEQSHNAILFATGQPREVLTARSMIQNLLPVQLCVNVNNSDLVSPLSNECREWRGYEQTRNVTVRITRSELEPAILLADEEMRHWLCIVTSELNVAELYSSLQRIVKDGLIEELPSVARVVCDEVRTGVAEIMGPMHVANRVEPMRGWPVGLVPLAAYAPRKTLPRVPSRNMTRLMDADCSTGGEGEGGAGGGGAQGSDSRATDHNGHVMPQGEDGENGQQQPQMRHGLSHRDRERERMDEMGSPSSHQQLDGRGMRDYYMRERDGREQRGGGYDRHEYRAYANRYGGVGGGYRSRHHDMRGPRVGYHGVNARRPYYSRYEDRDRSHSHHAHHYRSEREHRGGGGEREREARERHGEQPRGDRERHHGDRGDRDSHHASKQALLLKPKGSSPNDTLTSLDCSFDTSLRSTGSEWMSGAAASHLPLAPARVYKEEGDKQPALLPAKPRLVPSSASVTAAATLASSSTTTLASSAGAGAGGGLGERTRGDVGLTQRSYADIARRMDVMDLIMLASHEGDSTRSGGSGAGGGVQSATPARTPTSTHKPVSYAQVLGRASSSSVEEQQHSQQQLAVSSASSSSSHLPHHSSSLHSAQSQAHRIHSNHHYHDAHAAAQAANDQQLTRFLTICDKMQYQQRLREAKMSVGRLARSSHDELRACGIPNERDRSDMMRTARRLQDQPPVW